MQISFNDVVINNFTIYVPENYEASGMSVEDLNSFIFNNVQVQNFVVKEEPETNV
jgi:hypothetical protein